MAYVMVAIPAELVPAVTELIENHAAEPAPQTTLAGAKKTTAASAGFVHGWDRETVRRAYRESANKMREVLGFLAAHPGQEVTSEQIADAINARYGWNTIAGMLGAFRRRSSNRYRKAEPMWEYRYDDEGRVLLTMPPGAAKAIRDAAVN